MTENHQGELGLNQGQSPEIHSDNYSPDHQASVKPAQRQKYEASLYNLQDLF